MTMAEVNPGGPMSPLLALPLTFARCSWAGLELG